MLWLLQGCGRAAVEPTATYISTSGDPALRSAAFVLDVNTRARTVKVSPPISGASAVAARAFIATPMSGVHPSLLGGDAIEMRIANYVNGPVGAVVPGKSLVTFDLTLVNRLRSVSLTTPTFPIPPAGVSGVQAFPFDVSVLTSAGGVSSQGNSFIVTAPGFGQVIASSDWDGEPHSFFEAGDCRGATNNCFRYEPFGTIGASATSAPRRVGFLIDPSVRDLRIRLLVAADLRVTTAGTSTP